MKYVQLFFQLTASLILSVAIFVLLTTKALALQVASKAYEPSSTASRLFMSPTSAPLLNDHTRPASPFRDVHARNLHSKLSSLSRDSSQRPSNLSSSYSSAIKVPIHRLPLVSITAPSAVSVSAITHSDETNQETIAGGGRSRGNGFGTGGMGKGGGSDFGDGGNGGDGGDINGGDESDGGNGSGGRGRDGHFQ